MESLCTIIGTIQAANNKGADQTARMCRLNCACVVRIWHKQVFYDVAHLPFDFVSMVWNLIV